VAKGVQSPAHEVHLEGIAPRDRETVRQALARLEGAAAELSATGERMTIAQQIARFGNWEWAVEDDVVTWSEQLNQIFGLAPGDFAATFDAYLERVHPDDRERVADRIGAAIETGEPYVLEHRIVLPDGSTRTLRCDGQLVAGPEHTKRVVGVCQDVTGLTEAERARRSAELRFRDAFEHAPIGVALISLADGSPAVVEANRALCAITGLSAEELLATTLTELTVPEDRELDLNQRERLRAGEIESYTVEKRLHHKAGHQVWCQLSVSLSPAAAETGEGPLAIVQLQDVSERRRFEQRLRYLADHDSLTGLLNRRRFRVELEQQVAFNARYGGLGAVVITDIDVFKRVNDTLGHHAGDNLLRRVAGLLRERVRATDLIARLAGDEFAILMPQVDAPGALQLGEDLRLAISERAAAEPEQSRVTASVGVAMFGGKPSIGAEAVLVAADQAMYRAKLDGGDRVALHQEPDDSGRDPQRGVTTATRIRDALTHDRLSLHTQPIFDLGTGEVARHELLLRMGVNGDSVPAASFIETAEKVGMVQELDRWVVAQALELAAGRGGGGAPFILHVNLSGASFTDLSVLEFIERHLDESDADPSCITFEITETAAIHNFDTAAAFADRLTEFGCQVAIDDYGAGFGPFYYLKHLPFDLIKIDGDFVRNMPRSDADQLTVQAIVGIARGLGKQTIAEFVQDENTARMLRGYGVDMAQGYHLGMPRAVADVWG
jgi:diguanylate cyclase (GGDEF)-like protein/PAS domain S-box-containing protein